MFGLRDITVGLRRKWRQLIEPSPINAVRRAGCLFDPEGLRVFVTTVLRGSEDRELTGYLFEIDWSTGDVIESIPIPIDTGHPFWNSRGGNRGGRGICAHGDVLYVATAMSVLKYDTGLSQIGEITHPYLAGLHEMYVEDDGIWHTSTVHDLVFKTDFDGEEVLDEWWGSESSIMQRRFDYESRSLNLKLDFSPDSFQEEYDEYCSEERLHINSVWVEGQGVYILASKQNALIQIRPQPERVIIQDPNLSSPHNVNIRDGTVFLNNTREQSIHCYEIETAYLSKVLRTDLKQNKAKSKQFAKPGWQRGLTSITDTTFLVGTSPATVFEVDFDHDAVGRVLSIDDDVRHCIHDIEATFEF